MATPSTEPMISEVEAPRVLVVDDDEQVLRVHERVLTANGYRVELALSGSAALEAVDRLPFDVVLSDIDMPGMNGVRLLGQVRARDPHVPVLLITGNPTLATASAAVDGGAIRYLTKPVGLSELLEVVKEASKLCRDARAEQKALAEARAADVLRERAERRADGAEAARQSILGTLEAILACVPAFILVVDGAGHIRFINKVMSHHRHEDVIDSHWLDYLPPADHEQHRARLLRIMETGDSETYDTSTAGPDGGAVWLSSRMGPMREHGRIVGAVLVAQDVTELRRAQAEFVSAQRLAAVGTVAAGVAHEINTPVQFISDSMHFLRESTEDVFRLLSKLQGVVRLAVADPPPSDLRAAARAAIELEDEVDLPYLGENMPKAFERCVDGIGRIATIVRSMKGFSHPAHDEMAPADLNRAIQSTLLLSDVVMPKMSGPVLARRLAQTRPEMKVLCMSGYTDDAALRHGVIEAELAYLQKPFTVETLTRKVRTVLDAEGSRRDTKTASPRDLGGS